MREFSNSLAIPYQWLINTMSEDNRWPRNADTGDLLYCHAVGNKYGWYLNQLAVVINTDSDKKQYTIHMSETGKHMYIKDSDFATGNVEVISGANNTTIKKRMRKVDAMGFPRLKKIYWDDEDEFNHMGD